MSSLDDRAACCGTRVEELCFEDFWCQVRELYPSWTKFCECGTFDNLIASLVAPLFDMYVREGGVIDVEREANPLTSCLTTEKWMAEFGVPDACFDGALCFPSNQSFEIAQRAQMHAQYMLSYDGHPDEAFFQRLAALFGLQIELHAPTLIGPNNDTPACETYTSWSGEPPSDENGYGLTRFTNGSCRRVRSQFIIEITCAPQTLINYAGCGYIGQPMALNWYVDAFKCLVEKYRPRHTEVCFWDSYTDNPCAEHADPCPEPTFDDPCGPFKPGYGCTSYEPCNTHSNDATPHVAAIAGDTWTPSSGAFAHRQFQYIVESPTSAFWLEVTG